MSHIKADMSFWERQYFDSKIYHNTLLLNITVYFKIYKIYVFLSSKDG